jgi:hypothetical protein
VAWLLSVVKLALAGSADAEALFRGLQSSLGATLGLGWKSLGSTETRAPSRGLALVWVRSGPRVPSQPGADQKFNN